MFRELPVEGLHWAGPSVLVFGFSRAGQRQHGREVLIPGLQIRPEPGLSGE